MKTKFANEVIPCLWLGDEDSSRDLSFLREKSITHILVAGHCLKLHYPSEFHYLVLKMWDWEVEDMLRFIVPCIHFIDDILENKKGSLLIHCRAGVSRSATILLAYLMWKNSLSYNAAFTLVKHKRNIHPNSGFCYQLKMLEKALFLPLDDIRAQSMHPIDQINLRITLLPESMGHRVSRLGIERTDGGIETFSYFRNVNEELSEASGGCGYACVRCKRVLFTDLNIITFDNPSITVLSPKNLIKHPIPCSKQCPHHEKYFIEPMRWMLKDTYLLKQAHGNLHCPTCNYRLGEWNWAKSTPCGRNSCMAGVAPSFQILRARIIKVN